MRLVVGLGNPGRRYRGTRHNIAWDVLDLLARQLGIGIDVDEGFAEVGRGVVGGQRVLMARPQTYVNASGIAVADLRQRHRIPPGHLLVIVDDLDLPPGALRLRERGSHGGHRGLRSIIEALGTSDFPRMRIGIGRPPEGVDAAEFVLQRPTPAERAVLDAAVERAAQGVVLWITEGVQAAMRHCNVRAAGGTSGDSRPSGGPAVAQEDSHGA